MIFESIEHALHYASGTKIDIVIYENKVIDVTEFKEKHPGGVETIDKHLTKDITKAFNEVSSHQTKTAMKDIEEFTIGTIKLNSVTHKPILTEKDYTYDVDLQKGILNQVWSKMTYDEYQHFIHDPKHMINPSEAILFDTKALEVLTKTPWYVIPIIWVPVTIWYLYTAYKEINVALPILFMLYLIGIFMWSFIEYFLHRFIFHIDEKLPNTRFMMMAHFLLHGIHHAFPMDRHRLVFPPTAAYPLYQLIKFCVYIAFGCYSTIFIAGIITGYIHYDLTHYFLHHAKPKEGYYKNLKQYHVLHHYKDPKSGFGVSTKIWDYVFGTVLVDKK